MTASKRFCACVIYYILLHEVGTMNIYHRERRFFVNDKCHGVQTTLENVLTCPGNDDILLERLSRKKCDSFPQCQKEPLVYHCIRFGGRLVEVCAPRSSIAGHYCAVFEEGIGRVIVDYFIHCPECPSIYSSNESFKYSKCVQTTMKAPTFQTSTEQTNVVSESDEEYEDLTNETLKTTTFGGTTMNGLYPTRESENGDIVCHDIRFYVMVLVVNGVIIIIGLIVCCLNRTCKRLRSFKAKLNTHDTTEITKKGPMDNIAHLGNKRDQNISYPLYI